MYLMSIFSTLSFASTLGKYEIDRNDYVRWKWWVCGEKGGGQTTMTLSQLYCPIQPPPTHDTEHLSGLSVEPALHRPLYLAWLVVRSSRMLRKPHWCTGNLRPLVPSYNREIVFLQDRAKWDCLDIWTSLRYRSPCKRKVRNERISIRKRLVGSTTWFR